MKKNNKATFRPSAATKGPTLAEFIVPACDDRGHSTRMQFRCSPSYGRRITEVVHSGTLPYKTQSDLLRHALDCHLKFLDGLELELNLDMAQIDVINGIINRRREEIDFMNTIESLALNVQDLVAKGEYEKANENLREVLEQVDGIQDSYLRNSYKNEIRKRFSHLLREED